MGMYCILAQGFVFDLRSERREQTWAGSCRSNQEVYIGRQVQDMLWHKAHLEQCLQTFYVIMIQVYVICVVINARQCV